MSDSRRWVSGRRGLTLNRLYLNATVGVRGAEEFAAALGFPAAPRS